VSTAVADPETETPETPETPAAPVSAAESGQRELFKWSTYVHVGVGAEGCANGENGKCKDPDHFHAWCRIGNQFQMRDITEKATAAKARRVRLLKDPESDARIILESDLDQLRDPALKGVLIDEIVDRDFQEIYVEAVKEVDDQDANIPELEDEDDPDAPPVKKWATIDQDREEYQRLSALPEDERGEEFAEIEQRVADYSREIDEARERIMRQKREPLESREIDDLIDIVRRDRIDTQAAEAYLHAFNTWHWFACTYKPVEKGRPTERVFKDYNQMRFEADREVIEALQTTFNDLESRLARSRAVKKS
jgi:hypothetical protein